MPPEKPDHVNWIPSTSIPSRSHAAILRMAYLYQQERMERAGHSVPAAVAGSLATCYAIWAAS